MRAIVPRFVLDRCEAGERHGAFDGASVFVDVSGFVTLTESLAKHGAHGVEVLAGVMRALFDPTVGAAHAYGGWIASFAGDAFTAVFDDVAHALVAAREIRAAILDRATVDTPFGAFTLGAKIGVGAGRIEWGILSTEDDRRRAYYVRGAAIDAAAAAQKRAGAGEIQVDASAVAREGSVDTQRYDASDDRIELASTFFPRDVLLARELGEFRDVVTVFASLPPLDEHALASVARAAIRAADTYGGYLRQLDFGDKGGVVLAYFGAPVAHEDDVERALAYARALRDARADLRLSLTRGTAFAGFVGAQAREEYAAYGSTVNLAARILEKAEPGEIVCGASIARRAARTAAVIARGHHSFKGFAEPQAVFAIGEAVDAGASRSPFVGRQSELARLRAVVAAIDEGRGAGVIAIEGEAGVGKSRLVAELRASSTARWIVAHAIGAGGRSLQPLRAAIAAWAGLDEGAHDRRARFDAAFDALIASTGDRSLEGARSFVGALVDLEWADSPWEQTPPQGRMRATIRALESFVRALAKERPTVFEIDDLHHADVDTFDLLTRWRASLDDVPLAFVVTARPGNSGVAAIATDRIVLSRLDDAHVAEIARGLVGREMSPAFVSWLATRTEGNPFFVEQTLLFLRDAGVLDADDPIARAKAVFPPDVRALLVARLDRLPAEVRRAVQAASIFGREIHAPELHDLLVADGARDVDIRPRLDVAAEHGVWALLEELRWIFAHALLRDAAYDMQLVATRRRLHHLAARAIERVHEGAVEPHATRLAIHWEEAGDLPRAVDAHRIAAEHALREGSSRAAGASIESALTLLDRLPDDAARARIELPIRIAQGVARIATHGQAAPETLASYERARTIASSIGEGRDADRLRFDAHFGLRTFYLFRGDHRVSREMAEASLRAAEALGDEDLLLEGHHVVGNALFWVGELDRSRVHLEEVLARYRPEHHRAHLVRFAQNPRITSMFPYANGLALMGERARAVEAAEEALTLARSLGHAFGEVMVLQTLAWVHALLDEPSRAKPYAEQLVALAKARGFPAYIPIGEIPRGWAMIREGEIDAGLRVSRGAIEAMARVGMRVSRTISATLLARALRAAARDDEAKEEIEAGLAAAEDTGERACLAPLLGMAGRIDEGLEIARAQGARAIVEEIEGNRRER